MKDSSPSEKNEGRWVVIDGEEIFIAPPKRITSADQINALDGVTEVIPGEYKKDLADTISKAVRQGLKGRK